MSWTQRKGPSRPTATGNPPVQMYNPNQHSNPEVSHCIKFGNPFLC